MSADQMKIPYITMITMLVSFPRRNVFSETLTKYYHVRRLTLNEEM